MGDIKMENTHKNTHRYSLVILKKKYRQLGVAAGLLLMPGMALADNGGNAISGFLSGLITILTSGIAKALFVIAIIGIGYATVHLGKIPKERGIAAVIGIGLVFSAAWIAQTMGVGS